MEKNNIVSPAEYAEWRVLSYQRGMKEANQRENSIADSMITVQIQSAAVFIALLSVSLKMDGLSDIAIILILTGLFSFAVSMLFGLFGFWVKNLFWGKMANQYANMTYMWRSAWLGKCSHEHAQETCIKMTEGKRREQSSDGPMIFQVIFYVVGLILSFATLIVVFI